MNTRVHVPRAPVVEAQSIQVGRQSVAVHVPQRASHDVCAEHAIANKTEANHSHALLLRDGLVVRHPAWRLVRILLPLRTTPIREHRDSHGPAAMRAVLGDSQGAEDTTKERSPHTDDHPRDASYP